MAVRIVRDYWQNVANYNDLIRRCFAYLYKKFPNPQEGFIDSYHQVLLRLYELNVFARFDPRRLLAAKRGLSHGRARKFTATISQSKASKELDRLGINVEKKFEQFIYKWIEQILSEAYHNRVKNNYRYVNSGEVDYNPSDLKQVREMFNENCWAQTLEEQEYLQKSIIDKCSKKWIRHFPTPGNVRDFTGSKMDDPLEELLAQDLKNRIRAAIRTPREKHLLECTLAGISGSEYGRSIKKNPQQVHQMLRKIRVTTAAIVD